MTTHTAGRVMRSSVFCMAAAALCATAGDALAHGGYYRGPHTPDGIPIPTGGPTTPGGIPTGPITGGPRTTPGHIGGPAVTGRDRNRPPPTITTSTTSIPGGLADPALTGTAWEHWWALNKFRYLSLAAERLDVSRRAKRLAGEAGDGTPTLVDPTLPGIFRDAVRDANPDVRASGVIALARSRTKGATARLVEIATKDDSSDVRAMAVIGLTMVGGPEAFLALYPILEDEKQPLAVRNLAAVGVGATGGEDASALLAKYLDLDGASRRRNPASTVASAYYGLGLSGDPAAIPLVTRALKEPGGQPIVRSFAALAAARLEARDTLGLLFKAVSQPNVSMRRSAALSLGWILGPGDAQGVAKLQVVAATNTDPGTRRFATLELGRTRSSAIRSWLLDGFPKARPVDKPYVAIALALQGDASVAPALREALIEDEFEESLQAAYSIALGILGDREAVPLLEKEVLKRRRKWSPGYAALGLAMIGSRDSVKVIRERLAKTTDPKLETNLRFAMGLLRDTDAENALIERLGDDGSVYTRATAAMSLGLLRLTRAQAALRGVATAGDAGVLRAAGVSALGRIAATDETPLLDLLDGNNFSIELPALVRMGTALTSR